MTLLFMLLWPLALVAILAGCLYLTGWLALWAMKQPWWREE